MEAPQWYDPNRQGCAVWMDGWVYYLDNKTTDTCARKEIVRIRENGQNKETVLRFMAEGPVSDNLYAANGALYYINGSSIWRYSFHGKENQRLISLEAGFFFCKSTPAIRVCKDILYFTQTDGEGVTQLFAYHLKDGRKKKLDTVGARASLLQAIGVTQGGCLYIAGKQSQNALRYVDVGDLSFGSKLKTAQPIGDRRAAAFCIADEVLYWMGQPEQSIGGFPVYREQSQCLTYPGSKPCAFYIHNDMCYICRFVKEEQGAPFAIGRIPLAGGEEQPLVSAQQPNFTVIGEWLYYVSYNGAEELPSLKRVRLDGSEEETLALAHSCGKSRVLPQVR